MKLSTKKVYQFSPVMMDIADPPVNVKPGNHVKVKHLTGCPKPGTMGMTHVVHADTGEFAGLVCVNSLQPIED